MARRNSTMFLNTSQLMFLRSLFDHKDDLPEVVPADLRVPSSSCWSLCRPGWGRLQDTEPACCFVCKPCGSGEVSAGGDKLCTPCGRGYKTTTNHTACVALPVQHMNKSIQIAIFLISIVFFILLLITFFFFCYYVQTAVVRGSDRLLTLLLLLAMLLGVFASNLRLIKPDTGMCVAIRMLTRIALLASSIILLVKTSRFARLTFMMKTTRRARTKWTMMTPAQVLFVLLFLAFGVFLEGVMLAVDHPKPEINYDDDITYRVCATPVAQSIIGDVYLIGTILATAILAFFTRKLPKNYNEASFLFMTALSQCAVWGILRPLYYLAVLQNQQVFDISLVLFNMAILWLWLCVPRLDLLLRQHKLSRSGSNSLTTGSNTALTSTNIASKRGTLQTLSPVVSPSHLAPFPFPHSAGTPSPFRRSNLTPSPISRISTVPPYAQPTLSSAHGSYFSLDDVKPQ